tara:strand:+ start:50 stop:691 length:642 start_codon:yes stop_codon:yes gene_type:complete
MENEKNRKLSDKIINFLKIHGPASTTELTRHFKVTSMAIRQHLYLHKEHGLVSYYEKPASRGRPKRLWQLTNKAQSHFPNEHHVFFTDFIEQLIHLEGEALAQKVMKTVIMKKYTPLLKHVKEQPNIKAKAQCLNDFLKKTGYMSEYMIGPEKELVIIEHHCPIQSICQHFDFMKQLEKKKLQMVFESLAKVRVLSHILDGEHQSKYQLIFKE